VSGASLLGEIPYVTLDRRRQYLEVRDCARPSPQDSSEIAATHHYSPRDMSEGSRRVDLDWARVEHRRYGIAAMLAINL
jgi:hypothetical protein